MIRPAWLCGLAGKLPAACVVFLDGTPSAIPSMIHASPRDGIFFKEPETWRGFPGIQDNSLEPRNSRNELSCERGHSR
jgi:hypothetical protein